MRTKKPKSVTPDQLKEWRKRMGGISQSEAAKQLRVPFRTYQNWEFGRPQAFPSWLREQMQKPKPKKREPRDDAQLSFEDQE